jgi:hypothetical protein
MKKVTTETANSTMTIEKSRLTMNLAIASPSRS